MPTKQMMKRAIKIVASAVICIAVLLLLAVQAIQWQFRWRAERLLADMHRIHLYQSNWSDAQRLMHQWGAWGKYDGACTADYCQYGIRIDDIPAFLKKHRWMFPALALIPGLRYGSVNAQFALQDGTIQRSAMSALVGVNSLWAKDTNYALIVSAVSRQSLSLASEGGRRFGPDEQLEDHPNYKGQSPSGCEICMAIHLAYSTHASPAEIERLTHFNLSCFTAFRQCQWLEDLLPAVAEWHPYDHPATRSLTQRPPQPQPPHLCMVPVWTLGRDMENALVVESVGNPIIGPANPNVDSGELFDFHESAKVQIMGSLFGKSAWPVRTVVTAQSNPGPYVRSMSDWPVEMKASRRFIVFPDDQDVEHGSLNILHCNIVEDNEENRREIARGAALKDNFHGPEISPSWW